MSENYGTVVFAGFRVDDDWMWQTTAQVACGCGRALSTGDRFCASCGRRVPAASRIMRQHVWESRGFANADDCLAALVEGGRPVQRLEFHGDQSSRSFDVRLYRDKHEGYVLLAGRQLLDLEEPRAAKPHTTHPLPEIPVQAQLEAALHQASVPFLQWTWGLHVVMTV